MHHNQQGPIPSFAHLRPRIVPHPLTYDKDGKPLQSFGYLNEKTWNNRVNQEHRRGWSITSPALPAGQPSDKMTFYRIQLGGAIHFLSAGWGKTVSMNRPKDFQPLHQQLTEYGIGPDDARMEASIKIDGEGVCIYYFPQTMGNFALVFSRGGAYLGRIALDKENPVELVLEKLTGESWTPVQLGNPIPSGDAPRTGQLKGKTGIWTNICSIVDTVAAEYIGSDYPIQISAEMTSAHLRTQLEQRPEMKDTCTVFGLFRVLSWDRKIELDSSFLPGLPWKQTVGPSQFGLEPQTKGSKFTPRQFEWLAALSPVYVCVRSPAKPGTKVEGFKEPVAEVLVPSSTGGDPELVPVLVLQLPGLLHRFLVHSDYGRGLRKMEAVLVDNPKTTLLYYPDGIPVEGLVWRPVVDDGKSDPPLAYKVRVAELADTEAEETGADTKSAGSRPRRPQAKKTPKSGKVSDSSADTTNTASETPTLAP